MIATDAVVVTRLKRVWKKLTGMPSFVGSHLVRELALVYQRYIFFGALGALEFGAASVAVAPALFGVSLLTMITGELVILCHSNLRSVPARRDAVKYILFLEVVGMSVLAIGLLLAAALLPAHLAHYRTPLFVSVLILPASAFNQIAINWALLSGHRSLYSKAFYIEGVLILAGSQWLIDQAGLLAVPLAYCLRPMVLTFYIVTSFGAGRVTRELRHLLHEARVKRGREVHVQFAHQVGSLLIKSAWTSLDVMMVAAFAGEKGAGHYRILKTLASVPSVLISPVWGWLRPNIAQAIRERKHVQLARTVMNYSFLLSLPAAVMVMVPTGYFDAVYHVVFPWDDLPAGILKNSMILWWLVASGAGWARSLSLAAGQIQASTYGNILAFGGTFVLGPALVVWGGFNPIYVVPATLALVNIYWFYYLARFAQKGPAQLVEATS